MERKSKKKGIGLSIVKSSEVLRQRLNRYFADNGLAYDDIINDAKALGMNIEKSALSRYLTKKHPVMGSLTEETIVWMATRYGLGVNLLIGNLEVLEIELDGKKTKVFKLSAKPTSEEVSLAKLYSIWPKPAGSK